jgi:hypothetical protein
MSPHQYGGSESLGYVSDRRGMFVVKAGRLGQWRLDLDTTAAGPHQPSS